MSLRLLGHFFITLAGTLAVVILAKPVLLPLAFAILIAFLLYQPSKFLEKKIPRTLSIIIVFILAILLIVLIISAFGFMFKNIVVGLDDFDVKFQSFVSDCSAWIASVTGLESQEIITGLEENAGQLIKAPLDYLSEQLVSGATSIFTAMITMILAFLLLLYRTAFKNFFIAQIHQNNRKEASVVMRNMQKVSRQYLLGLFKVMAILGVLNSLGLWIIGVKYPLFWGFLAAVLTIIPYVGTFIGGFLPFLFTLVTTTTFWQPAAVAALFIAIQFLEDNFIKPKIVGDQVDLNPFVAILALLVGGLIWGIPGFVLALPYVAVLKIILEHFTETESVAVLMSSDIYDKPGVFKREYTAEKYSLLRLLKKQE